MHRSPDVLVAGAGPVGLLAAYGLARRGISAKVVDNGVWACAHSYALALHPRTVRLLAEAGVARHVLEEAAGLRTLAFYDARGPRASVTLDEAGDPLLVLPQSALENAIEEELARLGVHVQWRHKVMTVEPVGNRVRAYLNRYEKESGGYVVATSEWVVAQSWTENVPFVIGADGYASAVRRSIGIDFPEVGPCAWYGVFEFRSDLKMHDEVRVIAHEHTTDVVWPLGGGWFRWSFQLPDYSDEHVDRLAEYRERYGQPSERTKDRTPLSIGSTSLLPDSDLGRLIDERAQWFDCSIDEIGWRTLVRFEKRLASAFGKDRCWLAGDAAHLGSPISVQSLNLGIAEAVDLSAAVPEALHNGQGMEALTRYAQHYRSEWQRLQGIERTIARNGETDPWVWENRDRLVSCLPGYGEDLTRLAAQIGLAV